MNLRQKRFCDLYASGASVTSTAVSAGYSPRTAAATGSENLKKPELAKYLAELSSQATAETVASVIEIRESWTGVMRNKGAKLLLRLKASELLAKSQGAFASDKPASGQPAADQPKVIFYLPDDGREPRSVNESK